MSNIRIGLAKEGRVKQDLLKRITQAGFELRQGLRRDEPILVDLSGALPSTNVLMMRSADIPQNIRMQRIAAAIGGRDSLEENTVIDEKALFKATYEFQNTAPCSLSVLSKKESNPSVFNMEGKIIATSYPNITKRLIGQFNVEAKSIDVYRGGIEAVVAEGLADFAVDIWETGATAKSYGLSKNFEFMESYALAVVDCRVGMQKQCDIFSQICSRIWNADQENCREIKRPKTTEVTENGVFANTGLQPCII